MSGEAITLSRPEGLEALSLQALHPAYEASPSVTKDVPACAYVPAVSGRPSLVVVSSSAGLIITRSPTVRGKSSNAKQGARQGQALSRMRGVRGGRSSCAIATSAGLDGADLIRRWSVLTCSGGVADGEGTLSDYKVRCTGWGHVYLQLCIFGVSSVFRCIY